MAKAHMAIAGRFLTKSSVAIGVGATEGAFTGVGPHVGHASTSGLESGGTPGHRTGERALIRVDTAVDRKIISAAENGATSWDVATERRFRIGASCVDVMPITRPLQRGLGP
jgi:hypothetical protein